METVADFIFLGSKITAGGDCSHEIKKPQGIGWEPLLGPRDSECSSFGSAANQLGDFRLAVPRRASVPPNMNTASAALDDPGDNSGSGDPVKGALDPRQLQGRSLFLSGVGKVLSRHPLAPALPLCPSLHGS